MSRDPSDFFVLIIGSGFAGLGAAIRLKQAGIDDFAVLEKASEVGGTWRDNVYPGAACDVQSHLYSFSFEPWPEWTRNFAPQHEILAYLRRCADKYDVRKHIRFGAQVEGARFDEATGLWTVRTAGGGVLRARVVISGCGPLSIPALPDIPGIASFEGQVFHSSRWDPSASVEGKAVAVIGTGASAIQIVPAIAPRAAKLTVFQRTAPWVVKKPDGDIPRWKRAVYRRAPFVQQLSRRGIYWMRELLAVGFVLEPRVLKLAERMARRHLDASVADPALRERLRPTYSLGCKRVLPSNDYLPALQRPNVELSTDGIAEIRARSIVTRGGREIPVDALVLATGFHASEHIVPFEIRGRGGRDLAEAWKGGPEAYLGTTVSGFPNLFLMIGPNTGLGHSSMVFMIEAQLEYVIGAVKQMRARRVSFFDVRPDVQAAYNARIQERLKDTVWSSGCMSWYLTSTGKNTTIWPGFTWEYRLRMRRFDAGVYEERGMPVGRVGVGSSRESPPPRPEARVSPQLPLGLPSTSPTPPR